MFRGTQYTDIDGCLEFEPTAEEITVLRLAARLSREDTRVKILNFSEFDLSVNTDRSIELVFPQADAEVHFGQVLRRVADEQSMLATHQLHVDTMPNERRIVALVE